MTWLPNQLEAVLEEMATVYKSTKGESGLGKICEDIMDAALRQRDTLRKEVAKYCAERGVTRS